MADYFKDATVIGNIVGTVHGYIGNVILPLIIRYISCMNNYH